MARRRRARFPASATASCGRRSISRRMSGPRIASASIGVDRLDRRRAALVVEQRELAEDVARARTWRARSGGRRRARAPRGRGRSGRRNTCWTRRPRGRRPHPRRSGAGERPRRRARDRRPRAPRRRGRGRGARRFEVCWPSRLSRRVYHSGAPSTLTALRHFERAQPPVARRRGGRSSSAMTPITAIGNRTARAIISTPAMTSSTRPASPSASPGVQRSPGLSDGGAGRLAALDRQVDVGVGDLGAERGDVALARR